MANLPETGAYDAGVRQLETTDPVQGGVGGVSNAPLINLANRTAYLKVHMDAAETAIAGKAPTNSPTFTGSPAAPTASPGDSDTSVATTAFVQQAISGFATLSVAGNSNVTLTAAQYGGGIVALTGALTGNINVIFPTQADSWIVVNGTTGAFSVTCKTAAGTGVAVTQGKAREIYCDGTNIAAAETDLNNAALTGVPTAPTATPGTNTNQVATTAFVLAATGAVFGAEADVASAATADLGASGAHVVRVTGGTTITSLGSTASTTDPLYFIRFNAALTLTYNATSLILPGAANITTAAGDWAACLYLGSGNWRVLAYEPASGYVLPAALASGAEVIAGVEGSKVVTPATLATLTASASRSGLVELATNAETAAGSDAARAITPAGLASLGLAPAASPALTGNPTAPTASPGDNDTSIATTAFVTAAVTAGATPAASDTVAGKVELATPAEAIAGTDTGRAVTPATLAAVVQAGVGSYVADTGAANAAVAVFVPALTSLTVGMEVAVLIAADNTGATTLNANSLGADAVQYNGAALEAGALKAGRIHVFRRGSGSVWELVGPNFALAPPPTFVVASGRGTAGAASIATSRNVASVTRTSTAATYDVAFSANLPVSAYVVSFMNSDPTNVSLTANVTNMTSAGFRIRFQGAASASGSGPADPNVFGLSITY